MIKRWFNRRWPYRRVCLKPWCWRGQTNQHRCHLHQEGQGGAWYGYEVLDPWWVRTREWLAKHLLCPVVGHRPVRKFTGTIPCGRHD